MYTLSLCQEANFVIFPSQWINLEGAAPARRNSLCPKSASSRWLRSTSALARPVWVCPLICTGNCRLAALFLVSENELKANHKGLWWRWIQKSVDRRTREKEPQCWPQVVSLRLCWSAAWEVGLCGQRSLGKGSHGEGVGEGSLFQFFGWGGNYLKTYKIKWFSLQGKWARQRVTGVWRITEFSPHRQHRSCIPSFHPRPAGEGPSVGDGHTYMRAWLSEVLILPDVWK